MSLLRRPAVFALVVALVSVPAYAGAPADGPSKTTGNGTTTASGLKYWDLKKGTGAVARAGDSVTVHYTGWLADGKKFDSSVDRHAPFVFMLGAKMVIRGWEEGVAGMKAGGKRQLRIPPALGYGAAGTSGVIPPNATLVFEVELIGVNLPASAPATSNSENEESPTEPDEEVSSAVPDQSIARDIARSAAAHVDTSVFGIPLGKPLRLEDCRGQYEGGDTENNTNHPCKGVNSIKRPRTQEGADEVPVVMPSGSLPGWAGFDDDIEGTYATIGLDRLKFTVKGGVVVAATVAALGSDSLRRGLEGKYRSKPKVRSVRFKNDFGNSWESREFEWFLPGLHVKFELNSGQANQGRAGYLIIEYESLYNARHSRQEEQEAGRVKL